MRWNCAFSAKYVQMVTNCERNRRFDHSSATTMLQLGFAFETTSLFLGRKASRHVIPHADRSTRDSSALPTAHANRSTRDSSASPTVRHCVTSLQKRSARTRHGLFVSAITTLLQRSNLQIFSSLSCRKQTGISRLLDRSLVAKKILTAIRRKKKQKWPERVTRN